MDVIMFVAVDMRVSMVMVGLVGVGGFMLAAVAAKYFTKYFFSPLSSAVSTCGRESVCVDVSLYENDHVAARSGHPAL